MFGVRVIYRKIRYVFFILLFCGFFVVVVPLFVLSKNDRNRIATRTLLCLMCFSAIANSTKTNKILNKIQDAVNYKTLS
jgi:hypothetical protein